MGLPGGRGPIGPRVWSTFTYFTELFKKRFIISLFLVFNSRVCLVTKARRFVALLVVICGSVFRCADRDVFQRLYCDVTFAHLLSRVLEETAARAGQKATRWGSLWLVMLQVMLCMYLHYIPSTLLSPQGAMGFPGMLGQKVRQ